MTRPRILAVAVLSASLAGSSFAALSPEYAQWAKGPAQHLMTKADQARWKAIQTDAEAQAFIELFWARRDPTPQTPQNEWKIEFEERVQLADQRFTGRTRGSLTDRGKVYILLGPATRVRTANTAPGGQVPTPAGAMGSGPTTSRGGTTFGSSSQGISNNFPRETWIYDQAKTGVPLNSPSAELMFVDQYSTNEFKLESTTRTNHIALLQSIADSYVKQPQLMAVPAFATTAGSAITPTPAKSASLSAPVQSIIDEIRAGKAKPAENVFLSYAEFITPEGDYYVPVALYVPKVAGLDASAAYSFFGLVEKDGNAVVMFEDPVKVLPNGEDFYVEKSLTTLPPGKYKGTFGLIRDGKPVSVVTSDLDVEALDKQAAGISDLMLSSNIFALPEAQLATDPFAFGGMKVVPKADGRFRKSEELWYFFEIRNPSLDPATGKPKMSVQMSVTGTTTDGRKVRMNAPVSDIEAQELKGAKGRYAFGASIPLAKFRDGDYTMTLKITGVAGNQTYERAKAFKVAN